MLALSSQQFDGGTSINFVSGNGPNTKNVFTRGNFLPIFLVTYQDWLPYEGHMEITFDNHGMTNTMLEYSPIDLISSLGFSVIAGKFLTPIGRFQEDLHAPWIYKLPDRPAGFDEEANEEPISDMGVQLRGTVTAAGNNDVDYAFFVGNGPRFGSNGHVLDGASADDNGNKAIGGRIGFWPMPNLELGLSAMHADVSLSHSVSRFQPYGPQCLYPQRVPGRISAPLDLGHGRPGRWAYA